MTKLELIEYHLKKLKYFKEQNRILRSIDNSLKIGSYKSEYDKVVSKYRKQIKLHRDALSLLNRMEVMKWKK